MTNSLVFSLQRKFYTFTLILEKEEKTEELFSKLTKVERNGNNLIVKSSSQMKFKPQYGDKGRAPLEIDNVEWPLVTKHHTEF